MWPTPKRVYDEELLDTGAGTDADVLANFNDLKRINCLLGGTGSLLRGLREVLPAVRKQHTISILDVGTGGADIPETVSKWCARQGIISEIVAVDISTRNLEAAKKLGSSTSVHLVQADAHALPFADRTFDYVTASLFLHHFDEERVIGLLRRFAGMARRAVIINDLLRSNTAYHLFRAVSPVITSSYLTRHDGALSVLRGFTAAELEKLALAARLKAFWVRRVFPFRLLLVARTSD